MKKIKLTKPEQNAVQGSIQNLAEYLMTLDTKLDKTLYLQFEMILNATYDLDTPLDYKHLFFGDNPVPKDHDIGVDHYSLEKNKLKAVLK